MSGNTLTRAQLSEAVYKEVGLSRNESADLVESILNEISGALILGQSVKISSFGSFYVRQKNQRIGRNPKTGKMSKHYQLETNLSLTGSNADKRIKIKPSEHSSLNYNLFLLF